MLFSLDSSVSGADRLSRRTCDQVLDSWLVLNNRSLSGSFMVELKIDEKTAVKEIYSDLLQTQNEVKADISE